GTWWRLSRTFCTWGVVLLVDEFQQLVAEDTTPLLDLLRRLYQCSVICFILSGWMRPETLRRTCPQTQLFPLMARAVDFLPADVVRKVLREPVAHLGIEVPEATEEVAA